MQTQSLYTFKDYKSFIKYQISSAETTWGLISKLSGAAGCQRSYFSRAMTSHIHLTSDHAYGLCHYWKFSERETEYFLTLLEKDRVASSNLKKHLNERLKKLKVEHESLQHRVARPKAEYGPKEFEYYSAWYFSAVHILTSIPEYQTPFAISKKLQLEIQIVHNALERLESWQLVKNENARWIFNSSEIHASRETPIASLHHGNWRTRAVLNSQSFDRESLHFTVVQSVSNNAWEKIKDKLLQVITEVSEIAGPSQEEKLVCLALDFFGV